MFYAASEIVFWILFATVIGGGIGYGLSEARSIRLGKRLDASGAHAPLERELAIAWDTIEDLNRRLQVAHETIRGGPREPAQEGTDDSGFETIAGTAGTESSGELEDGDANDIVGERLSQRVASASSANRSGDTDSAG